MIPTAFQSTLNKYVEEIADESGKAFRFARDAVGNLTVYGNQATYRIPVIPLRPHQLEIQVEMFLKERRFFYVWRPRRSGKEVESWTMIIESAITVPGLYLMIYPTNVRARIVLWDGAIVLPDGLSLRFTDMIPRELIKGRPNDHEMTMKLNNGSVIRVLGADIDPDKLRGVNARGIVMSEYAFCDPRVRLTLMPVLRQNNGWLILQTTPNGMNHAYHYMQEMKKNDEWFCRIDTVETILDENGVRYISDDLIEEERRAKMPEWMIRQEYYCDIQANLETLYFSNEITYLLQNNKIVEALYVRDVPVYAAMDIGWNDTCTMALFQFDRNHEPVIISYYEKNNQPFEHYVRWASCFCLKINLYLKTIFVPHDGVKHDFNTAKNTIDFGRDLGVHVEAVDRPSNKINAIQSSRRMCYKTRFNKENTERLIECLSNYAKEFDEAKGIYKDAPLHNWASHGYDCFQTMTLAIEGEKIPGLQYNVSYYNS